MHSLVFKIYDYTTLRTQGSYQQNKNIIVVFIIVCYDECVSAVQIRVTPRGSDKKKFCSGSITSLYEAVNKCAKTLQC